MADANRLFNDVKDIINHFARLVTINPTVAQHFVEAVPNASLLLRIAKRLYSASRYIDVPLIEYDAPVDADCSPSAASNVAYLDDKLQIFHYPNPMAIDPGTNRTFPPSVRTAWESIREYITSLDNGERYYEPPPQRRYLEVEGDVE